MPPVEFSKDLKKRMDQKLFPPLMVHLRNWVFLPRFIVIRTRADCKLSVHIGEIKYLLNKQIKQIVIFS